MEEVEDKKADAGEDDKDGKAAWYELPPGAFFFTAGVLAAFLPKDTLFAGEYTNPTTVLLIVSNLVIFFIFAAFVFVVRSVGLTPAVQWMVSPGFSVEEPES
jgi:hypothetical protein